MARNYYKFQYTDECLQNLGDEDELNRIRYNTRIIIRVRKTKNYMLWKQFCMLYHIRESKILSKRRIDSSRNSNKFHSAAYK